MAVGSLNDAAKEFNFRTSISGGMHKTIISTHMEFRDFDQSMRYMEAVKEFIRSEYAKKPEHAIE